MQPTLCTKSRGLAHLQLVLERGEPLLDPIARLFDRDRAVELDQREVFRHRPGEEGHPGPDLRRRLAHRQQREGEGQQQPEPDRDLVAEPCGANVRRQRSISVLELRHERLTADRGVRVEGRGPWLVRRCPVRDHPGRPAPGRDRRVDVRLVQRGGIECLVDRGPQQEVLWRPDPDRSDPGVVHEDLVAHLLSKDSALRSRDR